ncbi:MAG: hypothetical protein K2J67_02930 [Lachnospiraceae bacterium]|nr:hypothetical protein [Lachnospiraceae bacterium]
MNQLNSRHMRTSSTHVPRYFILGLAIFCWFAALIQCLKSQQNHSFISPLIETTVPAYSTQSLKNSSSYCVYSHEANDYYDYYFYSPLVESAGIAPIGQGYNLHVAVKKDGHIYLGFPNITCDF